MTKPNKSMHTLSQKQSESAVKDLQQSPISELGSKHIIWKALQRAIECTN